MTFLETLFWIAIFVGILVIPHEFGHYLLAKRVGILVEEFSVGMGPLLLSRKRGETLYSLRALPLGGFCRMAGENPYEDSLQEDDKPKVDPSRTFYGHPAWQRILVVAAGPVTNFILAALVLALVFSAFGIPTTFTNEPVIGRVIPGLPAADAGLNVGDRVLKINGEPIRKWDGIGKWTNTHVGKELVFLVARGDKTLTFKVTPINNKPGEPGYVGIEPAATQKVKISPLKALASGFVRTGQTISGVLVGLYQLATGQTQGPLTGPLGIANMTKQAANNGFDDFLTFMAYISIQLGLFNLLPLPALDGGRLVFLGIEAVRRKPVNPEKEGFVHFIGFALLLLLLIFVSFKDIIRMGWFRW